jgi:hypothetical protein
VTSSNEAAIVDNPGEFIAAVPTALRFFPSKSIVMAAFRADPPRMECVVRADLPARREASTLEENLLIVAINQKIDFINLLVVGGGTGNLAHLPHRYLIDKLTGTFNEHGIDVNQALWVERIEFGLPWRCYQEPNRTGRIADPANSPMASETTIYATRKELAAQLTSDPPLLLDRRAKLLRALHPVRPDQAIDLIYDAVDQLGTSGTEEFVLDDKTLVRLGQALTYDKVRVASLKLALTERREPAERLWATLTRALPRSIMAFPTSLLAVCAFLRGEGTLAHIAVDKALRADPGGASLAKIVRKFLYNASTPGQFGKVLAEALLSTEANEESDSRHCIEKATDELAAEEPGEVRLSVHFELVIPPQALHQFVHLTRDLRPVTARSGRPST